MKRKMKKKFLSILTVLAFTLGLVSCSSSEDPAEPLYVNLERTATITGKILVNEDETSLSSVWKAPNGVTAASFIATIPYSDLNSGATGTYIIPQENITYESNTGIFKIKAPVSVRGSVVTVKFQDFNGNVRMLVNGSGRTVPVIWQSKTLTSDKVFPRETYNLPYWKLNGSYFYIIDTKAGDDI
jgi:hypothetical protein